MGLQWLDDGGDARFAAYVDLGGDVPISVEIRGAGVAG